MIKQLDKEKQTAHKIMSCVLAIVFFLAAISGVAAQPRRSSNIIYWNTAIQYAYKEVDGIAVSYLLQMDHKELRHRFTIVDEENSHYRIDFDAQSGRLTRNYQYEPKNNYAAQYREARLSLEEIIGIAARQFPSSLVVKVDLMGKKKPLVYEIELYDSQGKVAYLTMSARDGTIIEEKRQGGMADYSAKVSRWEAEKLAREMTDTIGGKVVSTMLTEQGGMHHYVILHMSTDGIFHETGVNAESGEMVYTRLPD